VFYDRFTELCRERNVSPSSVMIAIGLNKSNATFWKKGSVPKGDTLRKLADYFGVTVDSLVPPEYPPFPNDLAEAFLNGSTADNLCTLRESKGLSQKELAERTGIEVKYIRNFEDESSPFFPTEEDVKRLADVFRVEPKYILGKGISQKLALRTRADNLKYQMQVAMDRLSILGMEEAVKRVDELKYIPCYRATPAPQLPAEAEENKDIIPSRRA